MADYTLDCMDDDILYEFGGTRTCRCCGQDGLIWEKTIKGKWVLCGEKGIHQCPVKPLKNI